MKESLYIGSTPPDEDCEQLGKNYDPQRARLECKVYARQLIREHGPVPDGAVLKIVSNPHDFGDYLSVNLIIESGNEKHWDYFCKCEGEGSENWDAISREELG